LLVGHRADRQRVGPADDLLEAADTGGVEVLRDDSSQLEARPGSENVHPGLTSTAAGGQAVAAGPLTSSFSNNRRTTAARRPICSACSVKRAATVPSPRADACSFIRRARLSRSSSARRATQSASSSVSACSCSRLLGEKAWPTRHRKR